MENRDLALLMLQQEIRRLQLEKERYVKFLARYQDARNMEVRIDRKKSGKIYFRIKGPGDERPRPVRTGEEDMVQMVMACRLAKRYIRETEQKIKSFHRCLKDIEKYLSSPHHPKMPHYYSSAAAFLARRGPGAESGSLLAWDNASSARFAAQTPYRPEGLKHRCSNGLYVRSKSEMLIVETLLRRGIRFYYELERKVGGKTFHPDFTLYSVPLAREIIWEHFGMMNDQNYRGRTAEKLKTYWENGWRFCQNFIATYEEKESDLDLRQVNSLLDAYF